MSVDPRLPAIPRESAANGVVPRPADQPDFTAKANENAKQVLGAMQADLLACYKKRVKVSPGAHGFVQEIAPQIVCEKRHRLVTPLRINLQSAQENVIQIPGELAF